MNGNTRRNSLLALLASLFVPGLGYIYLNQTNKLYKLYFMFVALLALSHYLNFMHFFIGAVAVYISFLLLWLYSIKDTYQLTKKIKSIDPRGFHSTLGYVGFSIILISIVFLSFKLWGYKLLEIEVPGMRPTLIEGDVVLINTHYNFTPQEDRNKVIAFTLPKEFHSNFEIPEMTVIKRAIAMGGENFYIENGQSYVNKAPIDDSVIPLEYRKNTVSTTFAPVDIPEDYIFVLGDNRDNNYDSRHFGFVNKNSVYGQVLFIIWSKNWSRIGKKL